MKLPAIKRAWYFRFRMSKGLMIVVITLAMTVLSVAPAWAGTVIGFGFSYRHGGRYYRPHRFGFGGHYYRPYRGYGPAFSFYYYDGWPAYYPPLYYDGPAYVYPPADYQPGYRMTYQDARPTDSRRNIAWLRLEIRPLNALIYIDDQYAGTARDFTGGKKLLPVTPSDHTLKITAEGFESSRVDFRVNSLQTLDVSQSLNRLSSGQTTTPPPGASVPPQAQPGQMNRVGPILRQPYAGPIASRGANSSRRIPSTNRPVEPAPPEPAPEQTTPPTAAGGPVQVGKIVVKLESPLPEAAVSLDGQYVGMCEPNKLEFVLTNVPVGNHRIEISKPGYMKYQGNITVTADQTSSVRAVLQKGKS